MISLDKYLKLWQSKRNELPVNANPAVDWAHMQQALDKHLPVAKPSIPHKLIKGTGFKLIAAAAISSGIAALVYVGVRHHPHKKAHKTEQHDSIKTISSTADSLRTDSVNNIQSQADSTVMDNGVTDNSKVTVQTSGGTDVSSTPMNKDAATVAGSTPGKKEGKSTITSADNSHNANQSSKQADSRTASRSAVNSASTQRRVNPTTHVNGNSTTGAASAHRVNGISYSSAVGHRSRFASHGLSHRSTSGWTQTGNGNNRPGNNPQQSANNQLIAGLNVTGDNAQTSQMNDNIAGREPLVAPQAPWFTTNNQPLTTWQTVTLHSRFNDMMRLSPASAPVTGKQAKVKPGKKVKAKRVKAPGDTSSKNIDWGVLVGTSVPGASGLGDLSPGVFVSFDVHNKWAINAQVRINDPQNLSGSYTHANGSNKVSSPRTLTITDSRKVYSAQLPIYLEYKASENIRIKAGGLISLPMRQSGSSRISPDSLRKDSTYFVRLTDTLGRTRYRPGIGFGISAGVALHYKRFIFEATYLHPLRPMQVTSDLGAYTSGKGQVQFTVGFKLNRPKEK